MASDCSEKMPHAKVDGNRRAKGRSNGESLRVRTVDHKNVCTEPEFVTKPSKPVGDWNTIDNLSRYVLLGPLQTHWDSPVVSMKATGVPLPVLRFFTTRVYRNADFDLIVQ
jgi:hypothetical protein